MTLGPKTKILSNGFAMAKYQHQINNSLGYSSKKNALHGFPSVQCQHRIIWRLGQKMLFIVSQQPYVNVHNTRINWPIPREVVLSIKKST